MVEQQNNARLLRALLDFEKELIKSNNFLKQNSDSFKKSLALVMEKANAIEEIVTANAEAEKTVQKTLEEKRLLLYYSQLSTALSDLKKALSDFEEHSLKTEVFLESFRKERSYVFSSEQNALSFIEQFFSLYTINKAAFRPEFVGLIDLNDVAAQLRLEKKDKQHLLVDASKLTGLFNLLKKKNAAKNFHLDSAEIKLLVKNPLQLKVEAENAKIKRLDRLAKELEARFD